MSNRLSGYDIEIPPEWTLERVRDLTSRVGSGITPRGGSDVYQTEGVLFIRSQNVRFEGLDLSDVAFIDQKTHRSMAGSKALPFDVLLNITGASIGRCCVLPDGLGEANVNQHVCTVRLEEATPQDAEFLSSTLASPIGQNQIFRLNAGGNREGLNYEQLRAIEVPWPRPNERKKIARILTTLDNLIEKTGALIAKYQAIKQGMMHDLFSRGVDSSGQLRPTQEQAPDLYKQSELGWIPKEWDEGWLADEIGPITSGWSPLCDSVPATKDQWAIQKTTVCVWSGYDETENKRLPGHFQPRPHLEVQKDDILVTRKGPFDRVGVVVHVHETRPKLMFPDTVFRLRLKNEKDVLPAFVPFALGSDAVQSDWYGRKIGLADAQVNINHGILKTTYFPKPKPDEQQMIVTRLSQIQGLIRAEEKQLNKLSSVKSGLVQDLLTGKVHVKVGEAEEVAAHA
ncbi:EcoKI restriction-modification system protein HsdS [Stieleria bergensis]|uniref:EcoKI restriction-modification system protein HsdS n=1 Tax=Stieleria bergensis TaxID=2528025 RepID=A0A517STK6_9BACT|nr:EcoKI restriction-modification system protein HsdS [Planctomycetes bacterium SV_7m_r]